MASDPFAFVGSVSLIGFRGTTFRGCTSATARRRTGGSLSTITMRKETATGRKKAPPPVFATDMKGKVVWTLRGASMDDVDSIAELTKALPYELIEALVEDSEGCTTVCEASVKGTKEGEGYKNCIFGVALSDVRAKVKTLDQAEEEDEPPLVKIGELVTVQVNKLMPEVDNVKEKLTLGCMKKLKMADCVDVSTTVSKKSTAYLKTLKSYGFVETRSEDLSDDFVELTADLMKLNPDPQKKIM